jgi:hypothetical protein
MSIAPTGRRNGRTRLGLGELTQSRKRLLNLEGQNKVNAALAERKKEAYESTFTSAYICT